MCVCVPGLCLCAQSFCVIVSVFSWFMSAFNLVSCDFSLQVEVSNKKSAINESLLIGFSWRPNQHKQTPYSFRDICFSLGQHRYSINDHLFTSLSPPSLSLSHTHTFSFYLSHPNYLCLHIYLSTVTYIIYQIYQSTPP